MRFIVSIFILYISYLFAKKISVVVSQLNRNISQHKRLIVKQLSEIIFYIVFGFGVFMALINLGIQTTTIVTILGTVMVTIGLALQSTLSNVFSGIYVALSENFQLGDVIRIYIPFISKPIEGTVIDFNIAYVKIKESSTHRIMYLPNTSIAGNVLINMSQTI
jgi:small conductance mechanosensitive channel